MRVGYCCISIGVNKHLKKKDYILVNRGMIKKTFLEKGLSYVSELVILNLQDDYGEEDIEKYNLVTKELKTFINRIVSVGYIVDKKNSNRKSDAWFIRIIITKNDNL